MLAVIDIGVDFFYLQLEFTTKLMQAQEPKSFQILFFFVHFEVQMRHLIGVEL